LRCTLLVRVGHIFSLMRLVCRASKLS
jgi:hypothetical protein